ncbi:MAG: RNA polymerase sigma factor [Akkermansiaceae bacterium]|nr:RNA polymerase sigma factor [Akkermansiaceae bacterium]
MQDPQNRPDPRELLEAFVASKRSERAFTAVVENLRSLVYSSALRRTSRPRLAEEVTQDVFARLARKAESLCRHPSLQAWIFETTRRQAATAMRSERRRQRKIDALTSEAKARESNTPHPMDNLPNWTEAVPVLDEALDRLPEKERTIIIQRFYEGKKFREIANASGQTEGACKKRVQRALEKLSRMLSARGATLSATVIASALGSELARAAPVQSAAVMAPKALAATSSIPVTTLLTDTFRSMSKFKTTTMTAATVAVAAAIPFSQQTAEAKRIQAELRTVTSQQSASQQGAAKSMRTRVDWDQGAEGRTAGSLLASLDGPVDNRAFIRHMMEVAGLSDPLTRCAVVSRLQRMSPEERMNLLRALKAYPMAMNAKDYLAKKILSAAPEMSPGEKMDELIVWGRSVSQNYLQDWATSDPDAAMQWFWERRASGELDPGLGTFHRNLYEDTLRDLLWGVTSKSPAKGLALYRALPRGEIDDSALRTIARNITRGEITKGEQRFYREMLDTHRGDDRKTILVGVLSAFAGEERFDEGMAVVDEYVQSPADRDEFLESIFKTNWKPGAGFDWLVASTPEDEAPAVLRRAARTASFMASRQTLAWIDRQEPGVVRDHAYAGWVEEHLRSASYSDFPMVLPAADKIGDPALRGEIRQLIRTKWSEQDQEAVSPYIPAEVLERLEDL